MSVTLYTVGYEGIIPEEFLRKLKENNVETLVDVREITSSRKKDFSKTNLKKWMESNGIKYIHIKALGSPKEMRDRLRKTHNFVEFYNSYLEYIKSLNDPIALLKKTVIEQVSCLLCFERNAEVCHRSILAKYLKKFNDDIEVVHL